MIKKFEMKFHKGQVLVGVLIMMVVLAIVIPYLVDLVEKEAKWTVKQKRSNVAFHLAEAAVDRGRWKLQESYTNWTDTAGAGTIGNYDFDRAYTDVEGGSYAIEISADPNNNAQRIIEGVGRDASNNEVRRIRAIFKQTTAAFAARARKTASVGASCNLHWGPAYALQSIETGGRTFPRYYSAGNITPQDTDGAGGSNTDNVQWWSYFNVPPSPILNFDFYADSATASGTTPSGCGLDGGTTNYYIRGNATFKGCTDTSGKAYYITGDTTFASGGNNFVGGTMIIRGNLTITGNGGSGHASGSYDAHVPDIAWKEYGNSWATYQVFDAGAPSTHQNAVATDYVAASTLTYAVSNILVHGFIYTGGSQGLNGGGNGRFHGVLMSENNATINTSNFTIYYDDTVAIAVRTTNVVLEQVSWREVQASWPSGI